MSLCQSNVIGPLSKFRTSVRVRGQGVSAIVPVLSLKPQLHTAKKQGMDMLRRLCVTLGILSILTISLGPTLAAAQTQPTVDIDRGITLPYGPPWMVDPNAPRHSTILYFVPTDTSGEALARLMISTEHRRTHADALHRVEQIAHNRREVKRKLGGSQQFYVLGGWPTAERRYRAPLEGELEDKASVIPTGDSEQTLRLSIAIAADTFVVRFEGVLLPGASDALLDEMVTLVRGVQFLAEGNPDISQRDLHVIHQPPRDEFVQPPPPFQLEFTPQGDTSTPLLKLGGSSGELEVAATPNGQNVVVATQGGFFSSTDAGKTFPAGGPVPFKTAHGGAVATLR